MKRLAPLALSRRRFHARDVAVHLTDRQIAVVCEPFAAPTGAGGRTGETLKTLYGVIVAQCTGIAFSRKGIDKALPARGGTVVIEVALVVHVAATSFIGAADE
jgi:hypothetical protein